MQAASGVLSTQISISFQCSYHVSWNWMVPAFLDLPQEGVAYSWKLLEKLWEVSWKGKSGCLKIEFEDEIAAKLW